MRFKDFKIVIDGTFDSDDEIEKLKSVFGNKVQSDEVETEKPETDEKLGQEEDPSSMISPLQQELELEKAEQGKDSDHIDAITKDEDAQDDAKAQDKNYFPKGFL
jgi:hypothetical protein|tara:strand:+ start:177 stop:491 length:315 start_codon:yes stop_codon:yes gene_type:complete